jgi:hypothetical protein
MDRSFTTILVIGVAFFSVAGPPARTTPVEDRTAAACAESLREIFPLREKIKSIHPLLENLHPVAVAEGENLLIFKPDETRKIFFLEVRAPSPVPVSKGIRAAFPLEPLGGQPACVVSGEVFDSLDGYVTIFHEFVHCHQFLTCEPRLKERLSVYRRAMEKKDFMWELQHPFPYSDPIIQRAYERLLRALDSGREVEVLESRAELRRTLPEVDYEYMVWQEWKEGLARYIENRIRLLLGLDKNRGGRQEDLNRISFYAGGEGIIHFLANRDEKVPLDIEKTFDAIYALK